jgi:TusA-related sulfurtransferase
MAKIVDCRGLACPQPVIRTKRAMAEADELVTIVDNDTARMNVSRMARKAGYAVEIREGEDGIYLHIHRASGPARGGRPGGARGVHGPHGGPHSRR